MAVQVQSVPCTTFNNISKCEIIVTNHMRSCVVYNSYQITWKDVIFLLKLCLLWSLLVAGNLWTLDSGHRVAHASTPAGHPNKLLVYQRFSHNMPNKISHVYLVPLWLQRNIFRENRCSKTEGIRAGNLLACVRFFVWVETAWPRLAMWPRGQAHLLLVPTLL